MLARMLMGAGGGPLEWSAVATAETTGSSITIPASARAGDIAVLVSAGGSANFPAGWTALRTYLTSPADCGVHAKILASGDPGASIATTSGASVLCVVRPSRASGAWTSEGEDYNTWLIAQSLSDTLTTGAGEAPYLAIGAFAGGQRDLQGDDMDGLTGTTGWLISEANSVGSPTSWFAYCMIWAFDDGSAGALRLINPSHGNYQQNNDVTALASILRLAF